MSVPNCLIISRIRKLTLILVGLVYLVTAGAAWGQSHLLEGRVFDAKGTGVDSALVSLAPYGGAFSGGVPATRTKNDGSYSFTIPAQFQGEYLVVVSKPKDGYPNNAGLIFRSADESPQVVDFTPDRTNIHLDFHLRSPDGLVTGRVLSGVDDAPLPQAGITLRRVSDPRIKMTSSLEVDGTFLYALPDTPITLEISAPGFKTWKYEDGQTHKQYLSVKSGTTLNLAIRLEPE